MKADGRDLSWNLLLESILQLTCLCDIDYLMTFQQYDFEENVQLAETQEQSDFKRLIIRQWHTINDHTIS